MTTLVGKGAGGSHQGAAVEAPDAAATAIVAKLREAAAQMVAFSQTKLLLREAATLIERLEGEARLNRAEPR